jgi:hypothetical protein
VDDQRADGESRDDEFVFQALAATRRGIDSQTLPSSLKEGVEHLRDAVLRPVPSASSSKKRGKQATVLRLAGRSEGVMAGLEWLRSTGAFDEKQIEGIRRARLLTEDSNGRPYVRPTSGLAPAKAMFLMAIVGFLSGLWIHRILVADEISLPEIATSYLVGGILGAFACFVIDRSVRFERFKREVSALAPWLAKPPV